MNIKNFDLNLLRVFVAVYEQRSVSRAAHVIGLSQPAMSNALLRLRRACNDRLFVRTRLGMEPTALADRLAGPMREALETIEAALGDSLGFDPAVSDRKFRLLMSDVGEAVILPRLSDALAQDAPGLTLYALRFQHDAYADALASGEADLAIGNLQFLKPAHYQQRLFTDRYFCVVRRGHPLAEAGDVDMSAYLAARHIATTVGNADTLVDAALSRLHVRRRVALSVTHYHVAATVAGQTDLVVVLPEHAIPVTDALHVMPLPFSVPPALVRQFWHRRFHDDPANRWLRTRIASLALSEVPRHAAVRTI